MRWRSERGEGLGADGPPGPLALSLGGEEDENQQR